MLSSDAGTSHVDQSHGPVTLPADSFPQRDHYNLGFSARPFINSFTISVVETCEHKVTTAILQARLKDKPSLQHEGMTRWLRQGKGPEFNS